MKLSALLLYCGGHRANYSNITRRINYVNRSRLNVSNQSIHSNKIYIQVTTVLCGMEFTIWSYIIIIIIIIIIIY
jgi:hypothetical protein